MSNDSAHRTFALFAPNEAATQQDAAESHSCSHCVLIFKTRFYLYEHLHQVHGLGIETALKESGLKSLPQNKPKPDFKVKNKIIKSNFAFNCKNCSFKSRNWSVYSEHKKQCSSTSGDESPLPQANLLFKQQTSPPGSKEINSLKGTRKSISKDVKIYSKSPQTITKYFTATSSLKSQHQAKEKDPNTLSLGENSLKSGGVFHVTPTSIDMVRGSRNASLLSDLISDPTSAKPVDPFKEASLSSASKRTSKENEDYNLSKKAKLETGKLNHTPTSNCQDLSFEVSDDEETNNLVSEESEITKFYFCKHCDFKSASLEQVYNHYDENHPYLRYNSFYIEENNDQSATFRCLECPNEFSSDTLLRHHYNKHHSDAPDIFSLKSSDLNLVYKCFVCAFTSSTLHSLKEHHKDQHPSHKVENQLLYCKYSSAQHTAAVTHRLSEDHKSPEIPQPEWTIPDDQSPSLSPKLKLKAQDGFLYYCEKCTFSHKSVVVLHVHYKKCHPEEPISFDKIKQSVGALSVTASAQKTDMENHLSHSIAKEESYISVLTDTSESISVDRNLQSALVTESDSPTSPIIEKMFLCDRCDFSSLNIKSVVSHHNAKHGFTTTIQDILRYTAEMESVNVKVANVSNFEAGLCLSPQDLYYCQICNYGNPLIKGIIHHQNKVHGMTRSKEHILEYTAKIHDQIDKSKSHPTNSILPSGLPLPLVKGKTSYYFCYLCNYKNKKSAMITRHFFRVHKGCRLNSKEIAEHTSIIYERLQVDRQRKSTEQNPAAAVLAHAKKEKITVTQKSSHAPKLETRLKCFSCSYVTCHVYLMRKHLTHLHKTKMSFTDIVLHCGAGAHFEPGYHCDICSFHCDDPSEVRSHSVARHCGRSLSITFISTQLYLSADMCDPTKRSNSVNDDIPDGASPQTYPEAYSCKACSFKGTSFSSITSHYLTAHPSSINEDGSSLKVCSTTKQILSNTEQDYIDSQKDFDSFQAPLDFGNVKDSKEKAQKYYCPHCTAMFSEHGGLTIHIGMKHRDKTEKAPQLPKRIQIFKCSACSYVHCLKCGVISHTNIKHPSKSLKSDSLYIESEHLQNVEMKVKNGNWRFCGYICKECSQIYSSKERLNEHRKTHKQSGVTSQVTLANDNSKLIHDEIWCPHCGLYCASPKELSDHLLVCQKNNTTYPCVLCSNAFSTKVQLGIHYTRKHGEKAFFKHYAPVYNQPSDKTAQQKEISNTKVSVVSQTKTMSMFKCPSCRYVNSSYHGTLTHCQMRHPNIVVRAETLKTVEIDAANIVGYMPNSKNYGGFRCKKCPQIYGLLKKLKKHCETDHSSRSQATSQLSAQTQQVPVVQNVKSESAPSSQTKFVSQFRHFFKCSLCCFSTPILKTLGRHYRNKHGKSAYCRFYSPLFKQNNMKAISSINCVQTRKTEAPFDKTEDLQAKATPQVRVYKCSLCSYATPYRRYLVAHFKNRHKFDIKAINKHMEKFKDWAPTLPIGRFTCKKCNVFFASKGKLLAHYEKVHSCELKIDFTVVAERTYKRTGIFKCNQCKQKIFGIKNICKHLDEHRARMMNLKKMGSKIVEASEENLPSSSAEDEMKLQPTSEKTIKTPPVPTASLPNDEEPDQPIEGKHFCQRCKRTFMSLKGLRSHERSHVAFAALDNWTISDLQGRINKYIVYRPGTTRPYMCTLCSYRTDVLALSKSHFIKKHPHVSHSAEVDKHPKEETQQKKETAPNAMDDLNIDCDEEPENSFLEPPDVQRQLKHYTVMAQVDPASKTQDINLSDSRILPCEMCNFNSHHYSIMRRHYLRRHGKKLIRCKDCSFFTCLKQSLDLHEQMGHSCVQSEPTHQKNLCCPFCLYQSKNKNNMIDHIVLHREERMMPIEVRRSKLSRYLQGIVFRCYKCTFTSGSADSLDSHMAKHSDIKPFKCRLCYFDCTQQRELEAHLCDKHQVVRNHQLVGQVSLDQLEERDGRNSQDDEVLHGTQKDEQLLMNEHPNEEMEEEHPASDYEWNERILKDVSSGDIANTERISRQTFEEGFKDPEEDGENMYGNQAPTKPRETSESALVCMEEDAIEAQDFTQNVRTDVEDQKQIHLTECMDDASAANPNQKTKSNSEMQKAFTEDTVDVGKNDMIAPCSEPQMSPEVKQDRGFGDANPDDGHTDNPLNRSDESQYGEMPILEKYFKEQHFIFAPHCENSEKLCTKPRNECTEGSEMSTIKYQETQDPPILLATDGVPAVHSPVAATMFPCDLCGRSLTNTSELQRHMMRHGM